MLGREFSRYCCWCKSLLGRDFSLHCFGVRAAGEEDREGMLGAKPSVHNVGRWTTYLLW
jgi:hypothetical protein